MKRIPVLLVASCVALPLLGGCFTTQYEVKKTNVFGMGLGANLWEPNSLLQRFLPIISEPAIPPVGNTITLPITRVSYSPVQREGDPRPVTRSFSISSESETVRPDSGDSALDAAIRLYENGEYIQAVEAFRSLEVNSRQSQEELAKAGVYWAASQLMCGDREAARFTYRIALQLNPRLRQAPWINAFSPEQLDLLQS